MAQKTALITGITGQDGAYLSKILLEHGYRVVGLTRHNHEANTKGIEYLGIASEIELMPCDLTQKSNVISIIESCAPEVIYNLAAQSSVAQSFATPNDTIHFNVISVLNLLEAIRLINPRLRFYQASSSEMYGMVPNLPVNEQTVMHPLSPYAISKASAHWITVNYREAYQLFACCGVLFNHDSYLREPTFFTKKVIQSAINIKKGRQPHIEVGNIEVKRDFGYAPKYVEAIMLMMEKETPNDYLICSGKSVQLRAIILHVFERLGISEDKILVSPKLYRPTEITDMYGMPYKANVELNWNYKMSFFDVLDLLIEEEQRNNT